MSKTNYTGPIPSIFDDLRAVSPVVGVILLTGLVVLLAAIVTPFVFESVLDDSGPNAAFDIWQEGDEIIVQYTDGDEIDADKVGVTVRNEELFINLFEGQERISPGDYDSFDTGFVQGLSTILVVWRHSDGSSTVLSKETILVDPDEGSNFQVTIQSTNSPVHEKESLVVWFTVENTGDETDSQKIDLWVETEPGAFERVDNVSIDKLSPDDDPVSGFLEWETEEGDAAEDISVEVRSEDDIDTTLVTVLEDDDDRADFQIELIEYPEEPVCEGEEVTVVVDLTNEGNETDTQTIALEVGVFGFVDTEEVTLDPDETVQGIELTWDNPQIGEHPSVVSSKNDFESFDIIVESC